MKVYQVVYADDPERLCEALNLMSDELGSVATSASFRIVAVAPDGNRWVAIIEKEVALEDLLRETQPEASE